MLLVYTGQLFSELVVLQALKRLFICNKAKAGAKDCRIAITEILSGPI